MFPLPDPPPPFTEIVTETPQTTPPAPTPYEEEMSKLHIVLAALVVVLILGMALIVYTMIQVQRDAWRIMAIYVDMAYGPEPEVSRQTKY